MPQVPLGLSGTGRRVLDAPLVSEAWLKEHGCARRDLGDVPIPFVWMPDASYPLEFDLATYGEIDGEPGCYELEWFS